MEINFWTIFKDAFLIFKALWPFWILLIAIIVIKLMIEVILPNEFKKLKAALRFKKGEEWRNDREFLIWLRGLSPKEFEEYIADLFSKLGYKTNATGRTYDKGIDVVAEKDGVRHYIQCKKYITSTVGVGEVRDFYGSIADHMANGKGYFITTNKFTLEAKKFAEDKPIELVDGFSLIKYIRLAEKNVSKNNEKTCPKCGGRLEKKIGKYGKFWGCSNYPKCQYTENIKEYEKLNKI